MSKVNGSKDRAVFGGRGWYIALAFCLAAAGVIGCLTLIHPGSAASEAAAPAQVVQQPSAETKEAQAPAVQSVPEAAPEPEEPEQSAPEEAPPTPETLLPQVVSPLDGTTVTVFSTTELLYDQTMADWRTHEGIDIQADEGDAVKTAASGTVVSVTEDELMGVTVVIEHAGGYTTTYSSLQADPPVSEGQMVTGGDIIGLVGSTAAAEADMGPHLHFSVSKDGQVIDPAEYISE